MVVVANHLHRRTHRKRVKKRLISRRLPPFRVPIPALTGDDATPGAVDGEKPNRRRCLMVVITIVELTPPLFVPGLAATTTLAVFVCFVLVPTIVDRWTVRVSFANIGDESLATFLPKTGPLPPQDHPRITFGARPFATGANREPVRPRYHPYGRPREPSISPTPTQPSQQLRSSVVSTSSGYVMPPRYPSKVKRLDNPITDDGRADRSRSRSTKRDTSFP